MPFDSFGLNRPPEVPEFDKKSKNSVFFFEKLAFPGCIFVTYGPIDLRIASNERSMRVDVPFGSVNVPSVLSRIRPKFQK